MAIAVQQIDPVAHLPFILGVLRRLDVATLNEGGKGFFGPVGMKHGQRRWVTDPHPQPPEPAIEDPGRFIDVVDPCVAPLRGNSHVVRLNDLGNAVEHCLDSPQADGHPQHRSTKSLHDTPPVAVGPGYFAHEGTEAWSIPRGMLGRHLGFTPAPAVRTPTLMAPPVGHVQHDRRQLKPLVRVIQRGQDKRRVATGTPLGPQFLDRCGRQEHLTMAWMARFAPLFGGGGSRTLARLLAGRGRSSQPRLAYRGPAQALTRALHGLSPCDRARSSSRAIASSL